MTRLVGGVLCEWASLGGFGLGCRSYDVDSYFSSLSALSFERSLRR